MTGSSDPTTPQRPLTAAGLRAPRVWMRLEQHRKRPWRIVAALGPWLLVRFLLGRVARAFWMAIELRRF